MNKVYENPEAKVVLFQSTEKLALLSNEEPSTYNNPLNPNMSVHWGNKPGGKN